MDYCSAPGKHHYYFNLFVLLKSNLPVSSVDAERAFAIGRRQVSFEQHGMNSQTFKAKMAVGSWSKAPFFPGFEKTGQYLISDRE
ncbi:hypothetical protein BKA70DRAFT_1116189 [Coprinopsis sp. MPI-PUGE-AT-0042]|nr:hypothetical protein BKA70DRAFT_1116189 [Coprinopsis sp. MPI-PUGE-AT-0042]